MKEKFGTSQKAIDNIITGCEGLLHHSAKRIEAGVNHHLSKNGVDIGSIPDVRNFFDNLRSPFTGLTSSYLQQKYYRENFGLIVSDTPHVLYIHSTEAGYLYSMYVFNRSLLKYIMKVQQASLLESSVEEFQLNTANIITSQSSKL